MGFRRVGALAKYITSDVAPHQVQLIIKRLTLKPSRRQQSILLAQLARAASECLADGHVAGEDCGVPPLGIPGRGCEQDGQLYHDGRQAACWPGISLSLPVIVKCSS